MELDSAYAWLGLGDVFQQMITIDYALTPFHFPHAAYTQ